MSYIQNRSYAQIAPGSTGPCLKAKAAQTRNLMPLMEQMCTEYAAFLGPKGAFLSAAVKELNKIYRTMSREDARQLPQQTYNTLCSATCRFLSFWDAYGGHKVYKFYALFDIIRRSCKHGNPKFYHTYADEQETRVLGTVAKKLHGGHTFYVRFLQRVLMDVA